MSEEHDTERHLEDIVADLQAAEAPARQMCDTCRVSLKGLRPNQVVYRPTADLIKLGYPVPNPAAQYTGFTVGDYFAFFDEPLQDSEQ